MNFGSTRVYYTKDNKSTCALEKAGDIKYCRRYKDYSATPKVCMECHPGFKPDYNAGTYGAVCVSEDHPGAMPGCKSYDYLDKSTT